MRVLLVTGSFPPMTCGVGDYTHALARALSQSPGVEVAVLTSTGASLATDGAGYEVFPVIREWRREELATVKDVIRRWKPDVVHIQYPTQGYRGHLGWQLPIRLLSLRIPVVQTWHEYYPRLPSLLRQARMTVSQAALGLPPGDVIVVRPEYARHMPWWYRLLTAHKRLHFVPNAPSIPRVALTEAERAAVRARYAPHGKALLAFFGFFFEHKGIDDVLEILDPERHHLVMVGEVQEADAYQKALVRRLAQPPLAGNVTMSGFLPPLEAARVLAAADAVVLPFRQGGGNWNTSINAAVIQGTFVLTTSTRTHGFDAERNVYYARPGDTVDLKQALASYLGRRNPSLAPDAVPAWTEIAQRHLAIYERHL